jgi:hypothetical protein
MKRSSWHYKMLRRDGYINRYIEKRVSSCDYIWNIVKMLLFDIAIGIICLALAIALIAHIEKVLIVCAALLLVSALVFLYGVWRQSKTRKVFKKCTTWIKKRTCKTLVFED